MIAMGNLSGVLGSYMFLDSESSTYLTGFGSLLSFAAAGLGSALLLQFLY